MISSSRPFRDFRRRVTVLYDAGTIKRILLALIAIATSQLVYWLALAAFENAARPDGLQLTPEVSLFLTETGEIAPEATPVTLPLSRDPAYIYPDPDSKTIGVFVTAFDAAGAKRPLALYLGWLNDIAEVRLNGELIRAQTPAEKWGVLVGWHPVVYIFPEELVRDRNNVLSIRVTRDYIKVLPFFYVGDAVAITSAFAWADAVTFDLVIAATGVMAFVALLCLSVNWPADDRPKINALVALLGAWTAKNLTYLGIDPFPEWFHSLALNYSVAFAVPIAFVYFASAWTGLFRSCRKWLLAIYAALLLFPVILVAWENREVSRIAWNIEMGLSITAMILVIGMFAWRMAGSPRREALETLLFIFCASAILSDAIDERFYITFPFTNDFYLNYYVHPAAGLLLALGVCAVLAAQATRARQVVLQINETLSSKLAESEAEIRAHEKEKSVAEERRRIMRDMHDGLGSRLTLLAAMASQDTMSNAEVARGLCEGLDELRLIVDSLDTAGESLGIAIGAFRDRIEPKLAAASINLHWLIDDLGAENTISADDVLQIFRILQEACSNAVRHSNAANVSISLKETPEGAVLCVSDDGCGIPNGTGGGVGLKSMRERAEAIGARLELIDSQPGLTVRLVIPSALANGERLPPA